MANVDRFRKRIERLRRNGLLPCPACRNRETTPKPVVLHHDEVLADWEPGVSYCDVCGNITEERVQLTWD